MQSGIFLNMHLYRSHLVVLYYLLSVAVGSTTTSSTSVVTSAESLPAVGGVLTTLYGLSLGARNIGSLVTLVSLDDVKLYYLAVAHRPQVLLRIVLYYRSLKWIDK